MDKGEVLSTVVAGAYLVGPVLIFRAHCNGGDRSALSSVEVVRFRRICIPYPVVSQWSRASVFYSTIGWPSEVPFLLLPSESSWR